MQKQIREKTRIKAEEVHGETNLEKNQRLEELGHGVSRVVSARCPLDKLLGSPEPQPSY